MERVTSKYAGWTRGQVEALINIIGEENAEGLLAGDISAEFKKVIKKFFDKNGRRIPQGLKADVCDADWSLRRDQPRLTKEGDFTKRISLLHECLGIDTEVTAEQLKAETERLSAVIERNSSIANITKGVYLPVVLPKLVTHNLGAELELYLAGVEKSYTKAFGDWKFYNHLKNGLSGEVGIVEGSRHEKLISRMKQGPVIGLHFPNPLQGFSVNASREQMSTLPEGFVLSGLDTLITMIMYPDVLVQEIQGLCLATFYWKFADHSLSFKIGDVWLGFSYANHLHLARNHFSSGLLFLG